MVKQAGVTRITRKALNVIKVPAQKNQYAEKFTGLIKIKVEI